MTRNRMPDSVRADASIPVQNFLIALLHGYFPMGIDDPGDPVRWFNPERRCILPLDAFRFPRRLRRLARRHDIRATFDQDFAAVIAGCSKRDKTWINGQISDLYLKLHACGLAHSVEVRIGEELVGGLYGFALGGAFSGESMFSRFPGASQIALLHLVARLRDCGFLLLDVQFQTPHLARFGTTEISRRDYLELLGEAINASTGFSAQPSSESTGSVLQRTSHTS